MGKRLATIAAIGAAAAGVIASTFGTATAAAAETGTVCSSVTGSVKLSPGLEEAVAKVQNITVKGAIGGCSGSTVTGATFVAHLKTAAPMTCSQLAEGGAAGGTVVVKWSPKGQGTSHGTLAMRLASGATTAYGSITSGPLAGLGLWSPLTASFGSCSNNKAKLKTGGLSGSVLRIAEPPTAKIEAPAGGGVYTQGAVVATTFACTESAFGPGLESCVDSGGATGGTGSLDTTALGPQTYTVTAVSVDGQKDRATIHYEVVE